MTPKPYTPSELSILVEEYITQQRSQFTLKGLCSYIVYWGMEDGRIAGNQLPPDQQQAVGQILERIVRDGRIRVQGEDGNKYFAHTLNNTVVAPPRMLIAFLENNLNEDGSVNIPEVLQPYMGGKKVLIPNK